jgi:hypothetical protein
MWGTNINTGDVQSKFRSFIMEFVQVPSSKIPHFLIGR